MSESTKYWSRWAVGVGVTLLLALAASIYATETVRVTKIEQQIESFHDRLPRVETKLDEMKRVQERMEKKLDDALRGR